MQGHSRPGLALTRSVGALLLGGLVGEVPYLNRLDDFIAEARAKVPLFDDAMNHFLNSASAQSPTTKRSEFNAGVRSLAALARPSNSKQMKDLLLVITDIGVQSTLSADLDALIKLEPKITLWAALKKLGVLAKVAQFGVKVASLPLAFEILILQTGGNLSGPGPMVIKVGSQ